MQNTYPLAACFVGDTQTEIKVRTSKSEREVDYFNFNSVGKLLNNNFELRVHLPNFFTVTGQNANEQLSLRLDIRDTINDKIIYTDETLRRFGVVSYRQ